MVTNSTSTTISDCLSSIFIFTSSLSQWESSGAMICSSAIFSPILLPPSWKWKSPKEDSGENTCLQRGHHHHHHRRWHLLAKRRKRKRGSRREERQSAADNGQRSVYCTTEYSVCVLFQWSINDGGRQRQADRQRDGTEWMIKSSGSCSNSWQWL